MNISIKQINKKIFIISFFFFKDSQWYYVVNKLIEEIYSWILNNFMRYWFRTEFGELTPKHWHCSGLPLEKNNKYPWLPKFQPLSSDPSTFQPWFFFVSHPLRSLQLFSAWFSSWLPFDFHFVDIRFFYFQVLIEENSLNVLYLCLCGCCVFISMGTWIVEKECGVLFYSSSCIGSRMFWSLHCGNVIVGFLYSF